MDFPSVFWEKYFWIIPCWWTRPRFLSTSSSFKLHTNRQVILPLHASFFIPTITMFFQHVSSILTIHLHNPPNKPQKARHQTTSITATYCGNTDSTTFFAWCIMSKPITEGTSMRSRIQDHFTSKIGECNTYFIKNQTWFFTKLGRF